MSLFLADKLKVANAEGECICRLDSMLFMGQCVMLWTVLSAIIVPVFVLLLIFGYVFHVVTALLALFKFMYTNTSSYRNCKSRPNQCVLVFLDLCFSVYNQQV